MTRLPLLTALAALVTSLAPLATSPVAAGDQLQLQVPSQQRQQQDYVTQVIVDPTVGHFSPRLGARFEIATINQMGYTFQAARLVSTPVPGSPLHQLGLQPGDVITRLDNLRITTCRQLENHHLNTTVRFLRTSGGGFSDGSMYIRPSHFFSDAGGFPTPLPGGP